MARKDMHYAVADPAYSSTLLRNRRSYWADKNGYPTLNGLRLDPKYAPRHSREDYRAAVRAWWDSLDDAGRKFLGRDYATMAGVSAASDSQQSSE